MSKYKIHCPSPSCNKVFLLEEYGCMPFVNDDETFLCPYCEREITMRSRGFFRAYPLGDEDQVG